MKYYIATFCTTTTLFNDNSEEEIMNNEFRTMITNELPYLHLIDMDEDAALKTSKGIYTTCSLTFFAEISEDEYRLCEEKERQQLGSTVKELNNDIARMQIDPEFRKTVNDAWLDFTKE